MLKKAFHWADKKRVKLHLMKVEQELLQDYSCPPELKNQRKHKIALLNEYWKQEKFPENTEFPNKRLPHIKDKKGTLCAMAYIIHKSGNEVLVNDLAKTNNLVYINDVQKGPLIEWLEESGLTKKEAARIQPGYSGMETGPKHVYNVALIIYLLSLLVLGFINYQLVKWLKVKKLKQKVITHIYLGINSLVLAGLATLLIVEGLL